MPIKFRCKHCRQKLSITRRKQGRRVHCPQCGSEIVVPMLGSVGEAAAAREAAGPDDDDGPSARVVDVIGAEAWFTDAFPEAPPFTGEEAVSAEAAAPAVPMPLTAGAPRSHAVLDARQDGEGFVLRKAQTESDEMDLTPMVDMVFLLLIFFMITASFNIEKTIQAPPPDPDQKGATQTIQSIEDLLDSSIRVEIDAQNRIRVDDEPADPTRLADVILSRMRIDQKTELVLSADPRALHETVVTVVDAANGVGVQKIRLVSYAGSLE